MNRVSKFVKLDNRRFASVVITHVSAIFLLNEQRINQ